LFLRSGKPVPPENEQQVSAPLAPLSPIQDVARAALVVIFILALSMIVEMLLVSPLQSRAAQQRLFDSYRQQLATGTAPVAAGDPKGRKGVPVSYLEVPAIGVRQVVVEGTDAGSLFNGPGHRRDTPLPGQVGTSVVMGRRAGFGGPFARISSLKKRSLIKVTTGAGIFDYRVIDVRRSGEPAPPDLPSGAGRLVLVTAGGAPFVPSGLVLVDADLVLPGLGGSRPALNATTLPDSEKLMSVDLTTLWRLVLWLQALIALVLGAIYAWYRWDRAKTWIVFLPALMLVGLFTAGEVSRLLPNLL
jgi:LPXTG-site transpeptidase (sortase) family protein